MLKDMKSYCHLKQGQNGTRRQLEQYGEKLLCVRYRFHETRGVKIKTVELIVDERPLTAPWFKNDDLVPVSVAYDEMELMGASCATLHSCYRGSSSNCRV